MAIKPIQILINAKDEASAAIEKLAGRLGWIRKASDEATAGLGAIGGVASQASSALATLGPLLAGAFSVERFVGVIAEQEQLALSFQAIFGSAERAAKEMDFVRTTANKLGIESATLARSYQSLAAATKGTTLEGEQTRIVFEATARAMSVLGKSSIETDRALTAIAQMASKGTVSMEELRGQLGEALPGAMQAAAKGAGLTVEQLNGMVESGQVLARDLLPALASGLNDLYANAAPPQTIISEWARLKNTITDAANAIGEGGASKGIAKGLSALTVGATGVSHAADVAGTAIGEFVAAVQTGNFSLMTAGELNAKYEKQLRTQAEAAGLVQKAQGEANAATQAQVRAIDNLVASQERQATGALAVRASYAELAKGAKDYATAQEKIAAARQAEAGTLTSLVNIYGTEVEKRQASAQASEMMARAATDLARAREAEALIAQSYAIRLQEEAIKRNDNTEATKKEIDAAQKSATAKRAEADQSGAVARVKRIEVAAAEAAAEAYQDNASRLYELRGAAGNAARELERLVAAEKAGKATSEEVAAARIAAAKATSLYRDALADASSAAQRRVEDERQTAAAVQAAISVDVERVNAIREVAQANGDASGAAEAQRRATVLQAQAADESAAAARREAQAIREAASAREAELKATGQLTAERKAEIEAQLRSANLKDLEAQKSDILADKIRALADSEQTRTRALEESIAMQEKALELAERQLVLENKRRGVDKDGFAVGKDGQRIAMGGDLNSLTGIASFLKAAGIEDDKTARNIAREFADDQGNVTYMGNKGQKKYGGDTISVALLRAAERYTFGIGGTGQGVSPSKIPAQESTRTVRVQMELNGRSAGVVSTDSAGADVLEGLLRQLGSAKSVTRNQ